MLIGGVRVTIIIDGTVINLLEFNDLRIRYFQLHNTSLRDEYNAMKTFAQDNGGFLPVEETFSVNDFINTELKYKLLNGSYVFMIQYDSKVKLFGIEDKVLSENHAELDSFFDIPNIDFVATEGDEVPLSLYLYRSSVETEPEPEPETIDIDIDPTIGSGEGQQTLVTTAISVTTQEDTPITINLATGLNN